MKSGQNENRKVVEMKNGQNEVVKMKSGQNSKW